MNLTVPVVPILVPTKKREKPTLFCKCCAKLWKSWAAEFCELTWPAVASAEGSSVTAQTENRQEIMHTYIMERAPCVFMFSMYPCISAVWWYIHSTKNMIYRIVFRFVPCTFLFPLGTWGALPRQSCWNKWRETQKGGAGVWRGCRMGHCRGCLG